MTTQEYQSQLHVPELDQSQEVSVDVRRALAHPTIEEALTDAYMWPCGD